MGMDRYCWSTDEEEFMGEYESREEALEEGRAFGERVAIYTGIIGEYIEDNQYAVYDVQEHDLSDEEKS